MTTPASVWIKFAGWFQCRLAIDPDPCDEPRGVSGYVHAVAGEPDLDRVLRLQPAGTTPRSHCPAIGVSVVAVHGDARHPASSHPLIGAAVELLGDPMFEGRNHILAEDGLEAIVPCHVRIRKDGFVVQRTFADEFRFPPASADDLAMFDQLRATGVNISPGAVGEATGIFDLGAVWRARTDQLVRDLTASQSEVEKAALAARIAAMADPSNARFFGARMMYSVALGGAASCADPAGVLPGAAIASAPWPLEFWCGAWDPDALCGFMVGFVGIPTDGRSLLLEGIAAMMADPHQERR